AQEPNGSSKLVITYAEVCVDGGALLVEGMGILEYDSAANRIVSGPTEVFRAQGAGAVLPPQLQLGSPIFSGGVLYLVPRSCDSWALGGCPAGRIFVARVRGASGSWQSGGSYSWWSSTASSGWTRSNQSAQSVISGATPAAVTADSYGSKGMAIVEETTI